MGSSRAVDQIPEPLVWFIEWAIGIPNRFGHRLRHPTEFRVKMHARASVLKLFRTTERLETTTKCEASHTRVVLNLALHTILIDLDLLEFKGDMLFAVGRGRKQFVARHLALLLYESAEQLPILLGQDLRASLAILGVSAKVRAELDAIAESFNVFRVRHQTTFYLIRNLLTAHREHNALLQVEAAEAVDPLQVMRLAAEFSEPLNRLVLSEVALFREGLTPVGSLRDLLSERPVSRRLSQAATRWLRSKGQ